MAEKYKRREVPVPPSRRDENGKLLPTPYVPPEGYTKATVAKLLPKGSEVKITDDIVDMLNNMENDTGLSQETMEEDIRTHTHILENGSISMKSYVNAVKFCSLTRHYDTNTAWEKVFPERAHRLRSMGRESDITNHADAYRTTKTVRSVNKDMLVPNYLQYSHLHHAAIQAQFSLMQGKAAGGAPVSAMVQHLAAKELANITAQPEEMTLNIKTSPSDAVLSAQEEMNAQLKAIVAGQKKELMAGRDIIDVQAIGINFDEVGLPDE